MDSHLDEIPVTSMKSLSAFPSRLKALRERDNLSQEQLASKLHELFNFKVDKTLISKWENGVYKPNGSAITALVNLFKVTPRYILGKDEQPRSNSERWIVSTLGEVFAIWVQEEEADLLDKFRRLSSDEKRAVMVLVTAFYSEKRRDSKNPESKE